MTKAFSEIGNRGTEPVSDEGGSHSFSRQSHRISRIFFGGAGGADLEVNIMHTVLMDLI